MPSNRNTWAVVLAAGDGTRLAALTTGANGESVPKQYCSLNGDGSLLHDALERAQRVAPRERRCTIVAAAHERYWRRLLWSSPRGNIIVQPRNCGTANGVLLAVLQVLARDPLADIVFLPADHHVRDESALATSLEQAVSAVHRHPEDIALIGIEPDELDPDLGYIVPQRNLFRGVARVAQFVEKPSQERARVLLQSGAVWNSFIFAAHGPALLGLIRAHMPSVVEDMDTALALDARRGGEPLALQQLYDDLPLVDFSKAIVQRCPERLRVITAPSCGWSDLGTPERVAAALVRVPPKSDRAPHRLSAPPGFMNLAARHAAQSLAS
jgi:mannose-1-phosphate guanylyltransferase